MNSTSWPDRVRLPRYAIAVLEALQFSGANQERLQSLSESEWKAALAFCDSARLTLTLGRYCAAALPDWVRLRIARNYSGNALRFAALKTALLEIADCFAARDLDFVLLKGFAHSPDFTPDPLLRAQTDLDVWCMPESVFAARDLMLGLGYIPVAPSHGRHLAPMVRQANWQWRNDYFAPDLPMPVEIHHALWDEKMERIPGLPERDFWNRRIPWSMDGRLLKVLAPPDALAFASLHLLMHVLHGDLVLHRAWEIAHFLDRRASDSAFWEEWRKLHRPSLRMLQALVFALASEWFACALPPPIREEFEAFPTAIKLWLRQFGWSPVEALFAPNKDELWLNLCLLSSPRDRARVFVRRLAPMSFPGSVRAKSNATKVPTNYKKPLRMAISRGVHHLLAFLPTLLTGVKWYWMRTALRMQNANWRVGHVHDL